MAPGESRGLLLAGAPWRRGGRDIDGYSFDLHARSAEELIAEIGASFLRAEAGIESPDDDTNSAAYINDWMSQIRADKTLVVRAAKAAQKAVDYILNRRATPAIETAALEWHAPQPESNVILLRQAALAQLVEQSLRK